MNKLHYVIWLNLCLASIGFCADATYDNLIVNLRGAIGPGASVNQNYVLWANRNAEVGPGKATIYGYRAGTSSSTGTTGGSSFEGTIDAAIVGYNYWGNPYSAAMAAVGFLDYANSTVLSASTVGGYPSAKLCYRDPNNNYWSGYFNGTIYGTTDLILGKDQNNSRWIIHSTHNGSPAGQLLSFAPDNNGQWFPAGDTRYMALERSQGNLGIGMIPTSDKGKLQIAGNARVDGTIYCKELRVQTNAWADYVFSSSYKLKSLKEIEKYISLNKHLPGIPAEKEVLDKGVNVVEMQTRMLKTIEEMTLHMIALKKDNEILSGKIAQLEKVVKN